MDIPRKKIPQDPYQGSDGYELEMLWHCRSDPRFHYYAYIPKSIYSGHPPVYKLVCFIHGTKRNTQECCRLLSGYASRNHLIILCPVFPGGLLERGDVNSYKLLSYGGVRYDLALLSMADELAELYPVDVSRIFLCSWAGGGQFVNRFLYVHPGRLAAVCFDAPSRPTYLDDGHDLGWGTRDFETYFGKRPDAAQIRRVPIMMMVGENDTAFLGDSPYGSSRRQRISALQENLNDHGIEAPLYAADGPAHEGNDGEMAQIVMKFFQSILDIPEEE